MILKWSCCRCVTAPYVLGNNMEKTEVSKIVKAVMVILYFAAVFPMIIYFGRELKEIRALKTSDEIS